MGHFLLYAPLVTIHTPNKNEEQIYYVLEKKVSVFTTLSEDGKQNKKQF
jgi:hypothetical protein